MDLRILAALTGAKWETDRIRAAGRWPRVFCRDCGGGIAPDRRGLEAGRASLDWLIANALLGGKGNLGLRMRGAPSVTGNRPWGMGGLEGVRAVCLPVTAE